LGITLAHNFVSAKGNGTDLTLIQPSNWNDQHIIKCDGNMLLGNLTSGNAAIQQIPLSTFMATLLGAASASALAALIGLSSTGDGKPTLKTVADPGWVMMNDLTIGNTGSGATNFADPSTQALFTLLYTNVSDAGAPVLTSAGAASTRVAQGSAAAAWSAGCQMSLPKQLGRALVSANTTNLLGTAFGSNTLTLQRSDLPNVAPTYTGSAVYTSLALNSSLVTGSGGIAGGIAAASGPYYALSGAVYVAAPVATGYVTSAGTVQSLNGGVAQTSPALQPASAAWNVMVKL